MENLFRRSTIPITMGEVVVQWPEVAAAEMLVAAAVAMVLVAIILVGEVEALITGCITT
jgi:hypothetical protein